MGTVERITLFNVPNEEDQKGMIDQYKELVKTAVKDGKPYISNVSFGIALPDPRSREYNFGVKTTFASLADVEFYDRECAAHQALKAFAKGRVAGPPLTLLYDNAA